MFMSSCSGCVSSLGQLVPLFAARSSLAFQVTVAPGCDPAVQQLQHGECMSSLTLLVSTLL